MSYLRAVYPGIIIIGRSEENRNLYKSMTRIIDWISIRAESPEPIC